MVAWRGAADGVPGADWPGKRWIVGQSPFSACRGGYVRQGPVSVPLALNYRIANYSILASAECHFFLKLFLTRCCENEDLAAFLRKCTAKSGRVNFFLNVVVRSPKWGIPRSLLDSIIPVTGAGQHQSSGHSL